LNEIYQIEDEEAAFASPGGEGLGMRLPQNKSIQFQNLCFTYAGAGNEPVLKHKLNYSRRKSNCNRWHERQRQNNAFKSAAKILRTL
jgi:hypothetical protein